MAKYKVTIERVTVEEASFILETAEGEVLEDVDWGALAEKAVQDGTEVDWELISDSYDIAEDSEPEEVS